MQRRTGVSTWSFGGSKSSALQWDSGANLTSARVYDAFGNLTASYYGAWKGPFGYGGAFGYQSDSSGLQLLGHRYYDPTIGRFLTRDPIQDGRNWYAYCGNDPVNGADPDGLQNRRAGNFTWGFGDALSWHPLLYPTGASSWSELYRQLTGQQSSVDLGSWEYILGSLFVDIISPSKAGAAGRFGRLAARGGDNAASFADQVAAAGSRLGPGFSKSPAKRGEGFVFRDRDDPMNTYVRIDSRGATHVHVTLGGKAIGRGGKDVSALPRDHPDRHILYEEWITWRDPFRP